MKLLSEYKDDEALELLADIIEPSAEIFADKEIQQKMTAGGSNIASVVSLIIKKHKSAIIEIMAVLEGAPVNEYHCNIFTLPSNLIALSKDKDLMDFFSSQVQNTQGASSGLAMENTTETEKA